LSGDQQPSTGEAKAFDMTGGIVGILVFLVGIAMIIMVFTWVRGVFDDVDAQIAQARQASAAAAAADAEAQAAAEEAGLDPGAVVATPQQGPTIADVGTTVGLNMLGLLVLGWLGALVASKGAQLAGAHRGKRE